MATAESTGNAVEFPFNLKKWNSAHRKGMATAESMGNAVELPFNLSL